MEGLQPSPFPLGAQAWVAGQPLTFPLLSLPPVTGNALNHVYALDIEVQLSPSYTTAPTTIGENACIKSVSINDGVREWWMQGSSGNALRCAERAETGDDLLPQVPSGGGTGNPRYIRRRFFWNPPTLYGQPSDGAFNCAYLSVAGSVIITCGALLDMSGDCTAATGTVTLTAQLVKYFDKLIFPAYYPRRIVPITTGQILSQRALYGVFAFLDGTGFGTFAAGDIGNLNFDVDGQQLFKATNASIMTAAFQADMRKGQFSVMGEPRNATYDVAPRQMNVATVTALAAQALDLQMALWCPIDTRLTKLIALVQANLTVNFDGSNTGTQAFFGRFQPLTASDRGQQLAVAMQKLPGRGYTYWGARLADDTLEYNGPLIDFMPWQAKLNTLPF